MRLYIYKYQNLDLNGVITKVITKLSSDEDLNKKNNDKKNLILKDNVY